MYADMERALISSDAGRENIRPVPRHAARFNEWLSPHIVHSLALVYRNGTNDATKRSGIEAKNNVPYVTIQDMMQPAAQGVQNGGL